MSENILATSYKTLPEALKTANQIRRASLVVQEEEGSWKIMIINDRFKLEEDLKNIPIADTDGYININDSQGNILRNKVQLNRDDLDLFSELISKFSSQDNILNKEFNDISRRFRNLISEVKTETDTQDNNATKDDRTGVYELKTIEYSCHFKKFIPTKTILQQKLDNESYISFMLLINFNDKSGLDTVSPLFRKSKVPVKNLYNALSQKKSFQIVIQLKEAVLEKMKYKMFQTEDMEKLMTMQNPLGKGIFTDLANYNLIDIKVI